MTCIPFSSSVWTNPAILLQDVGKIGKFLRSLKPEITNSPVALLHCCTPIYLNMNLNLREVAAYCPISIAFRQNLVQPNQVYDQVYETAVCIDNFL